MIDDADNAQEPSGATTRPAQESSSQGIQWGSLARDGLLVLVLLAMLWLAFHVRLPSVDELRNTLDAWGRAAWLVFVLAYAAVAITPIPVTVMALASGVLFGIIEGGILSVIGALLGGWVAYWLARMLGKSAVSRLLGRHAKTVEERLENAGVEAVYLLRLMPGVPYWPVNYGSGAFGISQRDFLVGSGLGTVPGQISLVAVGAFIAEPNVPTGIVVGVAWVVVGAMTFFAYRRLRSASGRS